MIEITKKVLWQKNYVDFNSNNIVNHSNWALGQFVAMT